jgi:predicted nucleotide-binding protein
MYYHAIVETTEKNKKGDFERCYELNCTKLEDIVEYIVTPYTKQKTIYINGRYIDYPKIRSLKIKSSDKSLDDLVTIAQRTVSPNVFFVFTNLAIVNDAKYVTDITKETIKSIGEITAPILANESSNEIKPNNKIFIVHGKDDLAKTETARFVEKLGFSAIILHEQPSAGKTIIEKIEEHTNVGFAIVLYTPCDVGSLAGADSQKPRARQNVVFEHGYLIAKLGRHNVCALVKGDIEIPNDISGVVYIPLDIHGAWHIAVAKEFRKAGYAVDMNNVI